MTGTTGPAWRIRTTRPWLRAETFIVLALTLILAITYPAARDSGPFQAIEGEALDWRFRIRGPQAAGPEVAIVAIDDRTLAEFGRWPFSRAWLAQAVDAIARDGARCIVFDLLFVGSEAGGGATAAPLTEPSQDNGSPSAATDSGDRALAEAMARAGNVIVPFAFVYDSAEANVSVLPEAAEAGAYRTVRSGSGRYSALPKHPAGALVPLAALLTVGWSAHVTVFVEADGSLRRAHSVIRYGESYYPSLPVEAARVFLGLDKDKVSLDLGVSLSIGDRAFATDPETALAINYAGPAGTYETRSLIDVVEGRFAPGTFRDRLVLIGPKAVGLGDRFETPYGPQLPGVEVFANVADNFLRRGFLQRSSLTEKLDLLAIVLGGVLAALLGFVTRPAFALLAATALIGIWGAVNLASFIALQSWLNFIFPTLAMLLGTAVVIAGQVIRESRLRADAERRGAVLSRYVSPLMTTDMRGRPGFDSTSKSQMAAVMFVDLVGFTQASEKMTPAEAAELLRRFHDCVERASHAHGGVIDKFIGDGALVIFGLPAAEPSDAANAVGCARAIAREVSAWKAEAEITGERRLECGIGLHFGPIEIAEVGGSHHAQITATGDSVNVASRLEAMTRDLRTTIIISDAVLEAARAAGAAEVLEGFQGLPVQPIRGRERPVGIWAWPAPTKD